MMAAPPWLTACAKSGAHRLATAGTVPIIGKVDTDAELMSRAIHPEIDIQQMSHCVRNTRSDPYAGTGDDSLSIAEVLYPG